MRTDTQAFDDRNRSAVQEPTFVVEIAFDDAGTDLIYLTSLPVTGLTGEVYESVLADISGTTQKINPDKALSEIGSLSFEALDDGLTEKQRAKLTAGLGLRGKRARFYAGFQGLDWGDFTLVQTQIIRSASYHKMVYSWDCSDIQREMREEVFEVKSTSLAKTLEPGDTEIEVYSTDGFKAVQHPASPSGRTDAPGQKVGYIILEENSQKEIIRWTGKTATKFTGCTRGVLGTRPIKVEKDEDEKADNAPKVEEYVYLEMPAPMLAYAILTGSIYGEPGETLPDHWHLGIAPQYIRTADYTGIGEDLWDLDNADLGLPARIAGVTDEDGKQFVEEQLFLLMGCYAPVYANGEIGLRRMTGVLSNASAIRKLDRTNITKYSSLRHDMKSVINRIVIQWNWVDQREEFTRTNLLIDQKSIDTHGDADLKTLEFRALHGSRHSYTTLRNRFDALRDRYAGPPLRLNLDLMPDQNDLEVGDIVRVELDEVEDYTGETSGLNRSFEVQQVKVNWKTGAVSVDLFGSSQKAEPLPPEQEGAALPDQVYAVTGATEISEANFPGKVSSAGGITTITGDITLTGQDNLRSPSAIYYCLEDLTINQGVTVTISKNTQIRVKGFFQINGKIDGRGRGFPGRARNPDETSFVSLDFNRPPVRQGFIGATEAQFGVGFVQGYEFRGDRIRDNFWRSLQSGRHSDAPPMGVSVAGGEMSGIFPDLTGQPGDAGCASQFVPDNFNDVGVTYAYGGAGGAGGAGMLVVASGCEFGANGSVDTSGGDGEPGGSVFCDGYGSGTDRTIWGGRGAAGMPGAVYWLIVGSTSNPPTLSSSSAIAENGNSDPEQYSNVVIYGEGPGYIEDYKTDSVYRGVYRPSANAVPDNLSFEDPNSVARQTVIRNLQAGAYRVQFITGEIEPVPDTPQHSEKPAAVIVTEALNTPKTPNANLSTLEVSVTAPADDAYSYALVEYRVKGTTGWHDAGPASPEALITVPSDGTTYEVRARSVSSWGVVSSDAALAEITVTRIIGAQPEDPEVDEKIVIPQVRGLELEGQGNGTEFSGRDAKFVWRSTTITEWFEIGSEGQLGASAGELDLYFRDYQVEVWAQNQIVRTEWVKDPAFVYTYEKNAEDYARENGAPGAWRSFEIRVYCRGRLNQVSDRPAKISATNPAPTNITGLAITAGFNVIEIVYRKPDDLDFAGVQVWISETSGFDPDAVEPVATIADNSYVAGGLKQGQNYYVRLRPFDDFGIEGTTPTAEMMVTTRTGQDLDGLSGWAYEVDPVDRDFVTSNMEPGSINLEDDQVGGELGSNKLAALAVIAEKLASEAVTAEKIAALAVGTAAIQNLAVTDAKIKEVAVAKLLAGVINATGPITTESILRAVDDINNPTAQVGMGPLTLPVGGAQTSLLFWAQNNIGDVTFGVDEQGNSYFSGTLNVNDNFVVDDQGNVDSSGMFRFGGSTSNYVEFDGANLVIDTDLFKLGSSGNIFGGSLRSGTIDGNGDFTGFYAENGNIGSAFEGDYISPGGGSFEGWQISLSGSFWFSNTPGAIPSSALLDWGMGGVLSPYQNFPRLLIEDAPLIVSNDNNDHIIRAGKSNGDISLDIYVDSNNKCSIDTNGDINADGTVTAASFNSFTGAHDTLIPLDMEISEGDILCSRSMVSRSSISSILMDSSISQSPMEKSAIGVYARAIPRPEYSARPSACSKMSVQDFNEVFSARTLCSANAIGDGQVNVCSENGDFDVGDLICTSSVPGKGMRYDGHDVRFVVARCMEKVRWDEEESDVKRVACIYMCG